MAESSVCMAVVMASLMAVNKFMLVVVDISLVVLLLQVIPNTNDSGMFRFLVFVTAERTARRVQASDMFNNNGIVQIVKSSKVGGRVATATRGEQEGQFGCSDVMMASHLHAILNDFCHF